MVLRKHQTSVRRYANGTEGKQFGHDSELGACADCSQSFCPQILLVPRLNSLMAPETAGTSATKRWARMVFVTLVVK